MNTQNESNLDQSAFSESGSVVSSAEIETGQVGVDNTEGITNEGRASSGVRFVLNIPNVLTIIRLLAIVPLAILISYWPERRLATVIIFICIWVTDILDGFIARRFNMMTEFGKLFDPFVDKVFQVVTVIMLFSIGLVPLWVPLFYVVRETSMLFASTLLLTKHHVVVYSDLLGKLSTFLFVITVGIVYLFPTENTLLKNVVFILPALTSLAATIHYAVTHLRSIGATNDGDQQ